MDFPQPPKPQRLPTVPGSKDLPSPRCWAKLSCLHRLVFLFKARGPSCAELLKFLTMTYNLHRRHKGARLIKPVHVRGADSGRLSTSEAGAASNHTMILELDCSWFCLNHVCWDYGLWLVMWWHLWFVGLFFKLQIKPALLFHTGSMYKQVIFKTFELFEYL